MPDLQVREFQVRAVDADSREVTGIAVPWDQEIVIGSYRESIAPGACEPIENPKLFSLHRSAIGRLTAWSDTSEGWEITARISETPLGDEMYTLLRDGVIDRMSIGFEPVEHTETRGEDGSVTIRHTKVRIYEVSLVPFPAYDGAKVSAVRSAQTPQETPVPENLLTRDDLKPIEETLSEMERGLALVQAGQTRSDDVAPVFRSIGEYVKALVSGDERAQRALPDTVSGDGILKDQWIGDIVQLKQQRQTVTQAFSGGPLPAEGLSVEYGVLEKDTTDFGRQVAEGEELLHGKVAVDVDNAPVYTAGGYSKMSVQAIQRTTNINLLDLTWTALELKGAKYIEALTRAVALATVQAQTKAGATLSGDLTTQAGLIELLIDLTEHYDEETIVSMDGLFVAKDVFLALSQVPSTKSVLQVTGAPEDKLGTLTIDSPEANIAGLTVRLFPQAPSGTKFAYSKLAVKTLEAPGAPFRLTNDVNVVDLTKPLGAYTYVSSFAQVPDGIVPIVQR